MRIEEDFLGKIEVPQKAYYGSFTTRAARNFRLSRQRVHPELIRSVALIKRCAALANAELGMLDKKKAEAIAEAAREVIEGKLDSEFVLDAFQAGAGTPLHMNVNEVIANRAEELLGGKKGEYRLVRPNDHVNMSQSSNNVVPSAIKLACLKLCSRTAQEAAALAKALRDKGKGFQGILKIGRTHLQDAVPMTYGQTFDAYARAVDKDLLELRNSLDGLMELGVGGTAVGSGITAHPRFRERIIAMLNKEGVGAKAPEDGFEMTQDMNDLLSLSGSLRRYAITLGRIADDLRLLSSGPKGGIAEIKLPEVEPGSSIMPGKVNPSVPEAVDMVCFQVRGNDHAVELAAASGQLELNFATPLIAHCLLQNAELLASATSMFRACIEGLEVDKNRTAGNLHESFGYATALNPYLGYKKVSMLVKEAYGRKISLKDLILEKKLMDKDDLEKVIATATGPSVVDKDILRRTKA